MGYSFLDPDSPPSPIKAQDGFTSDTDSDSTISTTSGSASSADEDEGGKGRKAHEKITTAIGAAPGGAVAPVAFESEVNGLETRKTYETYTEANALTSNVLIHMGSDVPRKRPAASLVEELQVGTAAVTSTTTVTGLLSAEEKGAKVARTENL